MEKEQIKHDTDKTHTKHKANSEWIWWIKWISELSEWMHTLVQSSLQACSTGSCGSPGWRGPPHPSRPQPCLHHWLQPAGPGWGCSPPVGVTETPRGASPGGPAPPHPRQQFSPWGASLLSRPRGSQECGLADTARPSAAFPHTPGSQHQTAWFGQAGKQQSQTWVKTLFLTILIRSYCWKCRFSVQKLHKTEATGKVTQWWFLLKHVRTLAEKARKRKTV